MVRTGMKASVTAVVMLAGSLSGCFAITQEAAFDESGAARIEAEVALAPELSALLSNPVITEQMRQQGVSDLLGDCGKAWPADKPIPDGVRSIVSRRGKRGDSVTCTWTVDVSDPAAAAAGTQRMQQQARLHMPAQEFSLVPLDGRPGYRLRIVLPSLKLPHVRGDQINFGKAALDAIFLNRHMTFGISAQRIENTNGELTPDRRHVKWHIPIATAIDPSRQTPISIEADIIYR